ncbi:MAG TPA: hypothetical protein VF677_16545 [Flavobacterium sp.]|jgi:hypothetical protein
MGRVSILTGLILVTFISCNSYYQNKNGGYRPKRPKFELAKLPYRLKNNDVIDTNAVYVEEAIIYYSTEARKEEFFMRFFSNGRFCMGIARAKKLTLEDLNGKYDYNRIGYYKLQGNNLEMETFTVGGQFGDTPYYDKMYAIIQNDSILFVREDVNEVNFSVAKKEGRSFYVRRKVKGLTGTPDW